MGLFGPRLADEFVWCGASQRLEPSGRTNASVRSWEPFICFPISGHSAGRPNKSFLSLGAVPDSRPSASFQIGEIWCLSHVSIATAQPTELNSPRLDVTSGSISPMGGGSSWTTSPDITACRNAPFSRRSGHPEQLRRFTSPASAYSTFQQSHQADREGARIDG